MIFDLSVLTFCVVQIQGPLEIVSPIFDYSAIEWQHRISDAIEFFEEEAELHINSTCGFHIHVSPREGRWELLWLQRIAAAIITFDDVFDDCFPINSKNRGKDYFRSNKRSNPAIKELEREEILREIYSCQEVDDLINLINSSCDGGTLDQRNYAWNFTGVSDDKYICSFPNGTLEFRSPRATTDVKIITKWVIFAVTFLHASLSCEDKDYWNNSHATKKNLDDFLINNAPPGSTDALCWEMYGGI